MGAEKRGRERGFTRSFITNPSEATTFYDGAITARHC
jgi:hypothetical protein